MSEMIEALDASIAKWEALIDETPSDQSDKYPGLRNCPLCTLYWAHDCKGCPISEYTGVQYCVNTPYTDASIHWKMYVYNFNVSECGRLRELYIPAMEESKKSFANSVKEEVAFLNKVRQYVINKTSEEK